MGQGSSNSKGKYHSASRPQPQVRTRAIIDDDDKTSYDLWTTLESIYTAPNTQAIKNLRHQLDSLLYKDDENWDEHFSRFMNVLAQLASLDEEFSDKYGSYTP